MTELAYLGDSVYIDMRYDCFELFLNNGERNFDDSIVKKSLIVLEPEVATTLVAYIQAHSV